MFKKIRGIGLLELMLSLAIIAILLVMAVRYYQSASNSQKITQAVDMFSAVKTATKNYFTSTHVYPENVKALVDKAYLPKGYTDADGNASTRVSPWSTELSVTANSTGTGYFDVTMADIPQESCEQIVSRIAPTLSKASGETVTPAKDGCKAGGNDITVKYSIG